MNNAVAEIISWSIFFGLVFAGLKLDDWEQTKKFLAQHPRSH